jgi:hypothetical protein
LTKLSFIVLLCKMPTNSAPGVCRPNNRLPALAAESDKFAPPARSLINAEPEELLGGMIVVLDVYIDGTSKEYAIDTRMPVPTIQENLRRFVQQSRSERMSGIVADPLLRAR